MNVKVSSSLDVKAKNKKTFVPENGPRGLRKSYIQQIGFTFQHNTSGNFD